MEIKNLKLIKNKKGAKIIDIFIVMIIGIFCFGSFFLFTTTLANENDIDVPERYNESYQEMLNDQAILKQTTENLRDAVVDLSEASTVQQVAFNGILGVLALFKLPLDMIDPVFNTLEMTYSIFDEIPGTVIISIQIGILVILIFAFLRFVTQRGNDA